MTVDPPEDEPFEEQCPRCETVLSVMAALEARVLDLEEQLIGARNDRNDAEHAMDRAKRELANVRARMQMDREEAIRKAAVAPKRKKP